MRPTGKTELGQHHGQDLQDRCLFFIYRDKPDETAAVPADSLHDVEALEFGDDAPRSHLQTMLARLAFEQTVCQ